MSLQNITRNQKQHLVAEGSAAASLDVLAKCHVRLRRLSKREVAFYLKNGCSKLYRFGRKPQSASKHFKKQPKSDHTTTATTIKTNCKSFTSNSSKEKRFKSRKTSTPLVNSSKKVHLKFPTVPTLSDSFSKNIRCESREDGTIIFTSKIKQPKSVGIAEEASTSSSLNSSSDAKGGQNSSSEEAGRLCEDLQPSGVTQEAEMDRKREYNTEILSPKGLDWTLSDLDLLLSISEDEELPDLLGPPKVNVTCSSDSRESKLSLSRDRSFSGSSSASQRTPLSHLSESLPIADELTNVCSSSHVVSKVATSECIAGEIGDLLESKILKCDTKKSQVFQKLEASLPKSFAPETCLSRLTAPDSSSSLHLSNSSLSGLKNLSDLRTPASVSRGVEKNVVETFISTSQSNQFPSKAERTEIPSCVLELGSAKTDASSVACSPSVTQRQLGHENAEKFNEYKVLQLKRFTFKKNPSAGVKSFLESSRTKSKPAIKAFRSKTTRSKEENGASSNTSQPDLSTTVCLKAVKSFKVEVESELVPSLKLPKDGVSSSAETTNLSETLSNSTSSKASPLSSNIRASKSRGSILTPLFASQSCALSTDARKGETSARPSNTVPPHFLAEGHKKVRTKRNVAGPKKGKKSKIQKLRNELNKQFSVQWVSSSKVHIGRKIEKRSLTSQPKPDSSKHYPVHKQKASTLTSRRQKGLKLSLENTDRYHTNPTGPLTSKFHRIPAAPGLPSGCVLSDETCTITGSGSSKVLPSGTCSGEIENASSFSNSSTLQKPQPATTYFLTSKSSPTAAMKRKNGPGGKAPLAKRSRHQKAQGDISDGPITSKLEAENVKSGASGGAGYVKRGNSGPILQVQGGWKPGASHRGEINSILAQTNVTGKKKKGKTFPECENMSGFSERSRSERVSEGSGGREFLKERNGTSLGCEKNIAPCQGNRACPEFKKGSDASPSEKSKLQDSVDNEPMHSGIGHQAERNKSLNQEKTNATSIHVEKNGNAIKPEKNRGVPSKRVPVEQKESNASNSSSPVPSVKNNIFVGRSEKNTLEQCKVSAPLLASHRESNASSPAGQRISTDEFYKRSAVTSPVFYGKSKPSNTSDRSVEGEPCVSEDLSESLSLSWQVRRFALRSTKNSLGKSSDEASKDTPKAKESLVMHEKTMISKTDDTAKSSGLSTENSPSLRNRVHSDLSQPAHRAPNGISNREKSSDVSEPVSDAHLKHNMDSKVPPLVSRKTYKGKKDNENVKNSSAERRSPYLLGHDCIANKAEGARLPTREQDLVPDGGSSSNRSSSSEKATSHLSYTDKVFCPSNVTELEHLSAAGSPCIDLKVLRISKEVTGSWSEQDLQGAMKRDGATLGRVKRLLRQLSEVADVLSGNLKIYASALGEEKASSREKIIAMVPEYSSLTDHHSGAQSEYLDCRVKLETVSPHKDITCVANEVKDFFECGLLNSISQRDIKLEPDVPDSVRNSPCMFDQSCSPKVAGDEPNKEASSQESGVGSPPLRPASLPVTAPMVVIQTPFVWPENEYQITEKKEDYDSDTTVVFEDEFELENTELRTSSPIEKLDLSPENQELKREPCGTHSENASSTTIREEGPRLPERSVACDVAQEPSSCTAVKLPHSSNTLQLPENGTPTVLPGTSNRTEFLGTEPNHVDQGGVGVSKVIKQVDNLGNIINSCAKDASPCSVQVGNEKLIEDKRSNAPQSQAKIVNLPRSNSLVLENLSDIFVISSVDTIDSKNNSFSSTERDDACDKVRIEKVKVECENLSIFDSDDELPDLNLDLSQKVKNSSEEAIKDPEKSNATALASNTSVETSVSANHSLKECSTSEASVSCGNVSEGCPPSPAPKSSADGRVKEDLKKETSKQTDMPSRSDVLKHHFGRNISPDETLSPHSSLSGFKITKPAISNKSKSPVSKSGGQKSDTAHRAGSAQTKFPASNARAKKQLSRSAELGKNAVNVHGNNMASMKNPTSRLSTSIEIGGKDADKKSPHSSTVTSCCSSTSKSQHFGSSKPKSPEISLCASDDKVGLSMPYIHDILVEKTSHVGGSGGNSSSLSDSTSGTGVKEPFHSFNSFPKISSQIHSTKTTQNSTVTSRTEKNTRSKPGSNAPKQMLANPMSCRPETVNTHRFPQPAAPDILKVFPRTQSVQSNVSIGIHNTCLVKSNSGINSLTISNSLPSTLGSQVQSSVQNYIQNLSSKSLPHMGPDLYQNKKSSNRLRRPPVRPRNPAPVLRSPCVLLQNQVPIFQNPSSIVQSMCNTLHSSTAVGSEAAKVSNFTIKFQNPIPTLPNTTVCPQNVSNAQQKSIHEDLGGGLPDKNSAKKELELRWIQNHLKTTSNATTRASVCGSGQSNISVSGAAKLIGDDYGSRGAPLGQLPGRASKIQMILPLRDPTPATSVAQSDSVVAEIPNVSQRADSDAPDRVSLSVAQHTNVTPGMSLLKQVLTTNAPLNMNEKDQEALLKQPPKKKVYSKVPTSSEYGKWSPRAFGGNEESLISKKSENGGNAAENFQLKSSAGFVPPVGFNSNSNIVTTLSSRSVPDSSDETVFIQNEGTAGNPLNPITDSFSRDKPNCETGEKLRASSTDATLIVVDIQSVVRSLDAISPSENIRKQETNIPVKNTALEPKTSLISSVDASPLCKKPAHDTKPLDPNANVVQSAAISTAAVSGNCSSTAPSSIPTSAKTMDVPAAFKKKRILAQKRMPSNYIPESTKEKIRIQKEKEAMRKKAAMGRDNSPSIRFSSEIQHVQAEVTSEPGMKSNSFPLKTNSITRENYDDKTSDKCTTASRESLIHSSKTMENKEQLSQKHEQLSVPDVGAGSSGASSALLQPPYLLPVCESTTKCAETPCGERPICSESASLNIKSQLPSILQSSAEARQNLDASSKRLIASTAVTSSGKNACSASFNSSPRTLVIINVSEQNSVQGSSSRLKSNGNSEASTKPAKPSSKISSENDEKGIHEIQLQNTQGKFHQSSMSNSQILSQSSSKEQRLPTVEPEVQRTPNEVIKTPIWRKSTTLFPSKLINPPLNDAVFDKTDMPRNEYITKIGDTPVSNVISICVPKAIQTDLKPVSTDAFACSLPCATPFMTNSVSKASLNDPNQTPTAYESSFTGASSSVLQRTEQPLTAQRQTTSNSAQGVLQLGPAPSSTWSYLGSKPSSVLSHTGQSPIGPLQAQAPRLPQQQVSVQSLIKGSATVVTSQMIRPLQMQASVSFQMPQLQSGELNRPPLPPSSFLQPLQPSQVPVQPSTSSLYNKTGTFPPGHVQSVRPITPYLSQDNVPHFTRQNFAPTSAGSLAHPYGTRFGLNPSVLPSVLYRGYRHAAVPVAVTQPRYTSHLRPIAPSAVAANDPVGTVIVSAPSSRGPGQCLPLQLHQNNTNQPVSSHSAVKCRGRGKLPVTSVSQASSVQQKRGKKQRKESCQQPQQATDSVQSGASGKGQSQPSQDLTQAVENVLGRCAVCSKEETDMYHCCVVSYCSLRCQKEDWPRHAAHCEHESVVRYTAARQLS